MLALAEHGRPTALPQRLEIPLDGVLDHVESLLTRFTLAHDIGAKEVVADERMGKVSIVGTGIQSAPGYAARMFRTLSDAGINIEIISTSEIRITCIVPEERLADAVRALHKAFELETAETL